MRNASDIGKVYQSKKQGDKSSIEGICKMKWTVWGGRMRNMWKITMLCKSNSTNGKKLHKKDRNQIDSENYSSIPDMHPQLPYNSTIYHTSLSKLSQKQSYLNSSIVLILSFIKKLIPNSNYHATSLQNTIRYQSSCHSSSIQPHL